MWYSTTTSFVTASESTVVTGIVVVSVPPTVPLPLPLPINVSAAVGMVSSGVECGIEYTLPVAVMDGPRSIATVTLVMRIELGQPCSDG